MYSFAGQSIVRARSPSVGCLQKRKERKKVLTIHQTPDQTFFNSEL